MELAELRKEIDQIDDELIRLFCKRMNVSSKIADYKKATSSPIYHPEREREILKTIAQKAGPELEKYACVLYSTLFELSRSYQSRQNRNTGAQIVEIMSESTCSDKSSIPNPNNTTVNRNMENCSEVIL